MAEASSTSSAAAVSNQKRSLLQVRELGLTQIDRHPKDYPFIADVVFVHGLQGHPQRTWQSKSSASKSKRLRDRFKKIAFSANDGETQQHNRLFWPADILPRDFKDIRILTYGYDSMVTKSLTGPTSKNGIFQHGKSFLGALSRARIDCGDRPIIFVAHSLGGLLVKQALIEARKSTNDSSIFQIYNSSYGVIFFGTPHRGSDMASWGLLLKNIAQVALMDTNDAILTDLDPKRGSSKLEELRLDFDDVLRDGQRAQELRVFSFQEEQGMTGVTLLGGKVVPNESSSLDSRKYGSDTIHANHMGMCRFEDESDDSYEKFNGVLKSFITEIKGAVRNARNVFLESDETRRADLLQSLDYAERRARENQLQNVNAKEGSFSWIWRSSPSFIKWWSSRGGLYWISGKPGSGKSTLIEYLVNISREHFEMQQHSHISWTVLHFFFDFRGGKGVTNSFEGLIRSLLYQLIKEIPQLSMLEFGDGTFSKCSERTLRNYLRTALENAKQGICIFVDGLDEYEGSVLELIEYLKSLAKNSSIGETPVKICVSSRPEPIPSQLLQGFPLLYISDHNRSGIRNYCRLTLESLESMNHEDLDVGRLSNIVAERAEGVFLWVRFALEQIVLGHSSGETFSDLSKRLDLLPGGVEDIYDRILSRLEPLARKECMIMLQLVCFATTSLSWQELLVATDAAMDKEQVIYERLCGNNSYSTFTKRLRAKAIGLLELVGVERDDYTGEHFVGVKLIHKSVNTYLNQKGWQTLGGTERILLATHALFIQICLRYINRLLCFLDMQENTDLGDWKDWFDAGNFQKIYAGRYGSGYLVGAYPFLTYAATQIFRHAKYFERHSASSYPVLHGALTEQLVILHLLFRRDNTESECWVCRKAPGELLLEDFDSCHVAFLHDLALYCNDDLAARASVLGDLFRERTLRCAIYSCVSLGLGDTVTVSLALQNVTTIKQCHIEDFLKISYYTQKKIYLQVGRQVLNHESVKSLRLVDEHGQEVTVYWFLTPNTWNVSRELFTLFLEVASGRGEDLRERCGPEGNVVETLLKQIPNSNRQGKLRLLREYYESQSWPFEYGFDDVFVFSNSDDFRIFDSTEKVEEMLEDVKLEEEGKLKEVEGEEEEKEEEEEEKEKELEEVVRAMIFPEDRTWGDTGFIGP